MNGVVAGIAITILCLLGGLAGACSLVFSPDVKDLGEIVYLGFALSFFCFALARLVWLAAHRRAAPSDTAGQDDGGAPR